MPHTAAPIGTRRYQQPKRRSAEQKSNRRASGVHGDHPGNDRFERLNLQRPTQQYKTPNKNDQAARGSRQHLKAPNQTHIVRDFHCGDPVKKSDAEYFVII
jgi:hypothetical protein